jgi:hypothetical protein
MEEPIKNAVDLIRDLKDENLKLREALRQAKEATESSTLALTQALSDCDSYNKTWLETIKQLGI